MAYNEGRYDDALAEYRKALKKDPTNLEAKIGYRKTAPLAAEEHLKKAKSAQKHGQLEVETREVGMAVAAGSRPTPWRWTGWPAWSRRRSAAGPRPRPRTASTRSGPRARP